MMKARLSPDEWILYTLAKRWPSPVAGRINKFEAEPKPEADEMAYARDQSVTALKGGLKMDVTGLDILDVFSIFASARLIKTSMVFFQLGEIACA